MEESFVDVNFCAEEPSFLPDYSSSSGKEGENKTCNFSTSTQDMLSNNTSVTFKKEGNFNNDDFRAATEKENVDAAADDQSMTIDVDVCVSGSGFVESCISVCLAMLGYKVLQIDSSDTYGGKYASLSLKSLIKWVEESGFVANFDRVDKNLRFDNSENNFSYISPAHEGPANVLQTVHPAAFVQEPILTKSPETETVSKLDKPFDLAFSDVITCSELQKQSFEEVTRGNLVEDLKITTDKLFLYEGENTYLLSADGSYLNSKPLYSQEPEIFISTESSSETFPAKNPLHILTNRYLEFYPFMDEDENSMNPSSFMEGDTTSKSSNIGVNYSLFSEKEKNALFENAEPVGNFSPEGMHTYNVKENRAFLVQKLMKISSQFNIDLLPRLLYNSSPLTQFLLDARCSNYVDFRAIEEPVSLGFMKEYTKVVAAPSSTPTSISDTPIELNKNAISSTTTDKLLIPSPPFYTLEQAKYCSPVTLHFESVPTSKNAVFSHSHLTLNEKRLLMRFVSKQNTHFQSLQFGSPVLYTKRVLEKDENFSEEVIGVSWHSYLRKSGFNARLCHYLSYGICLCDRSPFIMDNPTFPYTKNICKASERAWNSTDPVNTHASSIFETATHAEATTQADIDTIHYSTETPWTAEEGMQSVSRFLSSIGIYGGNSAFLYAHFGTGDLPQALTRAAALHGTLHMLRTSICALTFTKIAETSYANNSSISVEHSTNTSACLSQNCARFSTSTKTQGKARLCKLQLSSGYTIRTSTLVASAESLGNLESSVYCSLRHVPPSLSPASSSGREDFLVSGTSEDVLSYGCSSEYHTLPSMEGNDTFKKICETATLRSIKTPLHTLFGVTLPTEASASKNASVLCHLVAVCSRSLIEATNGAPKMSVILCNLDAESSMCTPVHIFEAGASVGICPSGCKILHFAHVQTKACATVSRAAAETETCTPRKATCPILHDLLKRLLMRTMEGETETTKQKCCSLLLSYCSIVPRTAQPIYPKTRECAWSPSPSSNEKWPLFVPCQTCEQDVVPLNTRSSPILPSLEGVLVLRETNGHLPFCALEEMIEVERAMQCILGKYGENGDHGFHLNSWTSHIPDTHEQLTEPAKTVDFEELEHLTEELGSSIE